LVGLIAALSASAQDSERLSREQFARAMATVERGTSKEKLLALLGPPDDICTRSDPPYPGRNPRLKEFWCYGTNGHLTFPTLGCVYINQQDQVHWAYGGRPTTFL